MGKKSRNKQHRQQGKKTQPTQHQQPRIAQSTMSIPSLEGGQPLNIAEPISQSKPLNFGEQTQYIRSDIVRICLLLVIVAIALVVLVLVNDKTTYIKQLGQHLSGFLRLQ